MAAELAESYQVPRKVADNWMEADEIAPLLDGLDEVAEEHRAACAEAIETYHRDHERVPLVVCCRRAEYFTLPTRLRLHQAVVVQPLMAAQIDAYLAQGTGLAGLCEALAADRRLCSAARTPLMLSVMALTYQGMERDAIPRVGDETAWRRSLFGAYVPRMYQRRRAEANSKNDEIAGDTREVSDGGEQEMRHRLIRWHRPSTICHGWRRSCRRTGRRSSISSGCSGIGCPTRRRASIGRSSLRVTFACHGTGCSAGWSAGWSSG
jgi:hypothetical protein